MIGVLGDLHFGVNKDNADVLRRQLDYLETVIYEMKKKGITDIIQTGDIFHSRKLLNIRTFHWIKRRFFTLFEKENMNLHIIPGNHDLYYINENSVDSIEIISDLKNINVYRENTIKTIDGQKFAFIPWLSNNEKSEEFKEFIKNNIFDIIVGHFEIKSFELTPGYVSAHGLEITDLERAKFVITGHYHNKQIKKNIFYVGTPYELTWSDYGSEKGYWTLDKDELMQVKNKNSVYKKIYYSMEKHDELISELNESFKDKIVRIYLAETVNNNKLEKYITTLEKYEVSTYTIIESFGSENIELDEETKEQSLMEIIEEYVDKNVYDNKELLKKYLLKLHRESIEG